MKKTKEIVEVTQRAALHALRRIQVQAEAHQGYREGDDYWEAIRKLRTDANKVRAWVKR